MKTPKISVVMSVRSGMPYLKEAVQSILGQTYKDFEFIIIDDASTDRSWEYLKSLKDKRIKLIKNQKNLGLATALNIGLKIAKGEYIARMDADDISLPTRLETQLKFMIDNPKVDVCGAWADLVDQNGKVIGEKKYPTNDSRIKNLLNWQPPMVHPTFFAKTMFYKSLGGYDPKYDLAEEYELLVRARKDFIMANIPQKLLKWRLWSKRRSRVDMEKMGRIDLKIKLESISLNGVALFPVLALAKQILLIYLVPSTFKLKIAKYLKLA